MTSYKVYLSAPATGYLTISFRDGIFCSVDFINGGNISEVQLTKTFRSLPTNEKDFLYVVDKALNKYEKI